jgi:hypothetical protein
MAGDARKASEVVDDHRQRQTGTTTMSRFPLMGIVIGIAAIGYAAVSQAGISLRPAQPPQSAVASDGPDGRYPVSGCRIEKTLKYDFSGKPYLKKARICA